jgi:hypothetical protein
MDADAGGQVGGWESGDPIHWALVISHWGEKGQQANAKLNEKLKMGEEEGTVEAMKG